MSPRSDMKKSIFILALGLLIASCGRDGMIRTPYQLTEDDKGIGVDDAKMEFMNANVEYIANTAWQNQQATFNGCQPVITLDTNSKLLVIDFGAECKDADQVVRKGRIIVNYTRRYADSGAIKTITFDNYHYMGNRMTGYKKIENRGYYGDGHVYYSIVMADTMYLPGDNGYISWFGERRSVWSIGDNTNTTSDDGYEVTGSGSVRRANGLYSDYNILSTMVITNDCKYPRSGLLQMVPQSKVPRVIDFGSGDCDNKASMEVNTERFDIEL
jgi:hypothetical protein